MGGCPQSQRMLASASMNRAQLLWPVAVSSLERAHAADPRERAFADNLGTVLSHHGRALIAADRLDKAGVAIERSKQVLDQLVEDHPQTPDYRQRLVQTLDTAGSLLERLEKPDAAIAEYSRAVEIAERLVADYPDTTTFLESLPITLNNCGWCEITAGRKEQGLAHFDRATWAVDELSARTGGKLPAVDFKAWVILGNADAALQAGKCEHAIALIERASALAGSQANSWRDVSKMWADVGRTQPEARGADGLSWREHAIAALESAIGFGWRNPADLAKKPVWDSLRGDPRFEQVLSSLQAQ